MILTKKRILIIFFLLLQVSMFGWYLNSIYSEKYFWRDLLLTQIEESFHLDIEYQNETFNLFPNPGISFSDIKIKNQKDDFQLQIKLEELKVTFTWWSLYKKAIKLKSIHSKNGVLDFHYKSQKNTNSNNFQLMDLKRELQLHNLNLKDIEINLSLNSIKHKIYINTLNFSHFAEIENNVLFDIDYNNGNYDGEISLKLLEFTSFDDISIKGFINFTNARLGLLNKYYNFINKQDFQDANLTGSIKFEKDINDSTISFTTNLLINNLNFKNQKQLFPMNLKGIFNYQLYYKKLFFQNIKVKYGTALNTEINGNLELSKNILLNLDFVSDQTDIEKTMDYILPFLDYDSKYFSDSNSNFTMILKILSKNTNYKNFNLGTVSTDISYASDILSVIIHKGNFFEGNLRGEGTIQLLDQISYEFNLTLNKLNLDKLIQYYNPNSKSITGELFSNFKFKTNGTDFDEVINKLELEGNVNVKNGNLIGYVNFYKPILSLGKLINFRGPTGDSTEFKNIDSNLKIINKTISINDFKMKGVGIDASGSGKLDFDKNIDFRIIVGLGGIAGKALSIPIIYKGKLGENLAYIDPIWIGSVYFGTTLFGGPVGGIAGSALSEYARETIYKIKNLLPFTNNQKDGETD